jgi:hypothetical protein
VNPEEIHKIVSQALQNGVSLKWWTYFITFIIVILSSYLGAYLKRKGENFASKEDFNQLLNQVKKAAEETEKIKNEFYLTKATYDKYIEMVLDYYANIYRYYRACQEAASSTHIKQPDGSVKTTREIWEKELDVIVEDQRRMQGYIQILLPEKIQQINSNLINAFNGFRDIIKDEPDGSKKQEKLKECFSQINAIKQELESDLRRFLKIEQLIKSSA